jgi:hypothetical protein
MKPLWQSLTVRGGALAIVGALLSLFGVEVAPEDLQALADAAFAIVTAVGGIMAIWGKVRSNKRERFGMLP